MQPRGSLQQKMASYQRKAKRWRPFVCTCIPRFLSAHALILALYSVGIPEYYEKYNEPNLPFSAIFLDHNYS